MPGQLGAGRADSLQCEAIAPRPRASPFIPDLANRMRLTRTSLRAEAWALMGATAARRSVRTLGPQHGSWPPGLTAIGQSGFLHPRGCRCYAKRYKLSSNHKILILLLYLVFVLLTFLLNLALVISCVVPCASKCACGAGSKRRA